MSNEKAQEFAEQLNLEDFGEFGESMSKSLKELNRSLDRVELSYKKQSVITSFFQSNRFEFREECIFIFFNSSLFD